ncbi:MgtC/SapB family protein [Cohnella fermenti]|uniref:MgtC/SapB family protein n=1 Tax=Cohnella fermenti TaxID=2565925 RepID=A0A4S4BNM0_9BACL|nr:MgtC/SapB family protein [Cohnella fermenti]THF76423.1 MgtC/SapB family protein [Cohnella fermenti]
MEFEYLLQVVVAGVCGLLIGYERRNRMKEAGIRTHLVVAMGASLMMIISKYGFHDELGKSGIALDPSRIAAQVVSGVGFLGAGMIFMQRHTIKGLTTAAGIWATAGIGMAIGSGLYVLGIGVAILIFVAQLVLHGRFSWLASPKTEQLTIRMSDETGALENIQKILKDKGIMIINFHSERIKEEAEIAIHFTIKLPAAFEINQLLSLSQDSPFITVIEFQ